MAHALPWLVAQASQASSGGSRPGSLELKWRRPRSTEGTRVAPAVWQLSGSGRLGHSQLSLSVRWLWEGRKTGLGAWGRMRAGRFLGQRQVRHLRHGAMVDKTETQDASCQMPVGDWS